MSAPGWLEAVAVPLAPGVGGCGEDPRYWDDFIQLKGEIEKLQGTDFARVWAAGRELLAARTRDLRVAGYLIPAALFTGGGNRLLEAVRGYRIVLENFWEGCHPRQPAARGAALRWLNQPKIENFARRYAADLSPRDLEALREEIAGINRLARAGLGEEAPSWTVLNEWLKERISPPLPSQVPETAVPETATVPARASAVPAPSVPENGPIASERDITAATRGIRAFLEQQGEVLRAAYFARALRWGMADPPPHQAGKTRVTPPRASVRAQMERARAAGRWEEVLSLSESLFLEPGGQFDLDLQAGSAEAARALGRLEVADFITGQVRLLVRRFPELPRLAFEDGRPFAAPATRQWLQGDRSPENPESPKEKENEFSKTVQEARDSLRRGDLGEGLDLLTAFPAADERGRIRIRLAQARLCLEGGRPEVALPLLEELHALILETSLHRWERELAAEVWSALLDACRSLDAKGRGDVKGRMEEVTSLLCRIDPAAAVGLI